MNAAVGVSPVRHAERLSVRFSRGSFRNVWPELNRLRRFHAAEFCLAVSEHLSLG